MTIDIRFISSGSMEDVIEIRSDVPAHSVYDHDLFNLLIDGYWR